MRQRFLLTIFLLSLAVPALATEKLDGWFIAMKACEAYQSKNKLTNPGDIYTEMNRAYEMKGINKKKGDWYQIRMPDAPVTKDRWVAINCGVHVIAAGQSSDIITPDFKPEDGKEATDLLLALTWQPAFCEEKTSKPECKQLNEGLLPITETQLSLHGLWPQPRGNDYCGVSDKIKRLDKPSTWCKLPAPELDTDTTDRLAVAMPGTASCLERHEWIKHGTCFYGDRKGDEYYDDSLRVLDAINKSAIGQLFAENVGAEVDTADIRQAFDSVFGEGAGNHVHVACKGDQGRTLIRELTITLKGEITDDGDIGALILAADPQRPGCPRGIIDPAGLQ